MNAISEDDGKPSPTPKNVTSNPANKVAEVVPPTNPTKMVVDDVSVIPSVETVIMTVDDTKYFDALAQALSEASDGTFDILKFHKAVESLEKLIPIEINRYKTAFITSAAASGVTIPALLASYQKYVNVFEKEKQDFIDAVIGGLQSSRESLQKESAQVDADIQVIVDKIKELNDQMNTKGQHKAELETQISNIDDKIKEENQSFESALYRHQATLSNVEANIHKYLEESK